mgnify:CR=1 FL=1
MTSIKLRLDELYFTTVDDTKFSIILSKPVDHIVHVAISSDKGRGWPIQLHAGFVMEDGLMHTLAMANECVAGDITAVDVIFQLQKDLNNYIPL